MAGEPILVVDDNAVNLKLVQVLLTTEGYDVRTAADAPGALAVLDRFRPRLILMDLQLPGMDGLELTRRLKADPRTRDIAIVALTAFAMKGDEERAIAAGCDGYLAKPIDTRALPAEVARHIAAAKRAGPRAPQPQRILVVEDSPVTRKMVRLALESAGYDVVEAGDARAALEAVGRGCPDLALQDLLLPDMDGFELLRRMRAVPGCGRLPVLAFSGLLAKLEEARAGGVGFDDCLLKPLEPSRIIEAVRAHLPERGRPGERPAGGRRVIVAEDDPVEAAHVRRRLEGAGHAVTTAADGAEALAAARRERPDAVLADVLMPKLDGFGLCLEIRRDAALAEVPVVLVSPVAPEEADRILAHKVGANAIVHAVDGAGEAIEALDEALRGGPAPPASADAALVGEERTHRIIRHLERQVALTAGLAQRCTVQAAELSIVGGIAEAILGAADTGRVLGEVLARCLDAGEITAGAIFFRDAAGALRSQAHTGLAPAAAARLDDLLGARGAFEAAIASGRPVAIPSPEAPPPASAGAAREGDPLPLLGARSAIVLPIPVREGKTGALLVASRERDLSQPEPLGFARTVAAQLGQALALAAAFDRAREAVRVRDEFLSIASHELRTPITAMQLAVQAFARQAAKPGATPEGLSAALSACTGPLERQVGRLTKLVDQLLDVSRLSMGPLPLEPEPLDLVGLAGEVVERFAEQARRAGTALELRAPAPVPGRWDALRVEQVLTNLVANAIKYGAGKPVAVGVERAGDVARITVADQGIGIPAADQTRIFERFERAVSARHYGGLGLGLWIVRRIVEALGGRIALRSEPGAGSTFTVELPLDPARPADEETRAQPGI